MARKSKITTISKIRNPDAVSDAARLIGGGADIELVLIFLRDRGFDKIDSIYAIQILYEKQFPEAKNLVHSSTAWSDRYRADSDLMDAARESLKQLARLNLPSLPKIVIEPDDH
jgi:hypothetical protein